MKSSASETGLIRINKALWHSVFSVMFLILNFYVVYPDH